MPKLSQLAAGLQRREAYQWAPKSSWIHTVYAIAVSSVPGDVFVTMTSKNEAGQESRAIQVGWISRSTFVDWVNAPSAGAFYNAYVKGEASSFHPAVRAAELVKIKEAKVLAAQREVAKAQKALEKENKAKK